MNFTTATLEEINRLLKAVNHLDDMMGDFQLGIIPTIPVLTSNARPIGEITYDENLQEYVFNLLELPDTHDILIEAVGLMRDTQRIKAIKCVRSVAFMGLREAKDLVESPEWKQAIRNLPTVKDLNVEMPNWRLDIPDGMR